jgi:hypothetical protein
MFFGDTKWISQCTNAVLIAGFATKVDRVIQVDPSELGDGTRTDVNCRFGHKMVSIARVSLTLVVCAPKDEYDFLRPENHHFSFQMATSRQVQRPIGYGVIAKNHV